MTSLPVLSAREVVRAFQKLGWERARQRGSHIILIKPGHAATLSIPNHREVARGTLIRSAEITVEEFLDAMG